jgi:biopolymer transport protein ExbD
MAVNIRKGRALATLSLTPLIDIVFLLLIFFLVATRFAEEDRKLEVQLPTASDAQPVTEQPQEIAINIDDQGRFFVGGQYVEEDELFQLLQSARINNPLGQPVVIRADQRVPFQFVALVMNLCNRAGIFNYTVATSGDV